MLQAATLTQSCSVYPPTKLCAKRMLVFPEGQWFVVGRNKVDLWSSNVSSVWFMCRVSGSGATSNKNSSGSSRAAAPATAEQQQQQQEAWLGGAVGQLQYTNIYYQVFLRYYCQLCAIASMRDACMGH
jgi:hypothetical protein